MALLPIPLEFTDYEDPTVTVTMSPVVDVSAWTLTCTVIKNDGTKVTLTVGSGITITNGAGGVFVVTLTAANLHTLGPGTHYYEIFRTNSGSHDRVAFGPFKIGNQFTF